MSPYDQIFAPLKPEYVCLFNVENPDFISLDTVEPLKST